MFKVGQRVRVTAIYSTQWWNFTPNDVERYNNKIFKLEDDLGSAGNTHGWRVTTPYGRVVFTEDQFRVLKKKSEVKAAAKIPVVSLKTEVSWLNKVKKNFEDAGEVYSPYNDGPPRLQFGQPRQNIFGTEARNDTVRVVLGTPTPTPARYQGLVNQAIPMDEQQMRVPTEDDAVLERWIDETEEDDNGEGN